MLSFKKKHVLCWWAWSETVTLNILIYEQSDITIEKHDEKMCFFYIAAVIQFITKYDRFDVILL